MHAGPTQKRSEPTTTYTPPFTVAKYKDEGTAVGRAVVRLLLYKRNGITEC